MYNLSEAIWGEKAREAAAAVTSQKGGAVTKGKKEQTNKEKMNGNAMGGAAKEIAPSTANQTGDSQKASKKGQDRLSEEVTTTASPIKRKKQETRMAGAAKEIAPVLPIKVVILRKQVRRGRTGCQRRLPPLLP